jgi:predicted O-linked N-acetylglucosamine transferase (SPINDLY family)
MAILAATPGSVLWLLTGGEDVDRRLREAAEKAAVTPERLIFAPKAPNPEHFARIPLADLFLDTFPYGAHSTAADALTMGLPVLTFPGKGFAARFCHSIVAAAGIPELICSNPEDYVARAVDLAQNRDKMAVLRKLLEARRESSVLRDIPALARRLEELFWQMQGECERGETPVPDLRNLDTYYEIGAELVAEHVDFVEDRAYLEHYRNRLAAWNDFAGLSHDERLWPAPSNRSR